MRFFKNKDLYIGLLVLFFDQLTKYYALEYLVPGEDISVFSSKVICLSWNLTMNEGAAWGLFQQFPSLLLCMRTVFVAFLIGVYFSLKDKKFLRTCLMLVIAGAFSNIIDTLIYGSVVDMIHCFFFGYNYPVFNVADMAICTGAVFLVFHNLFFVNKSA